MSGTCMITRSGRMVDLLNVKPEDIDLEDIAHALAHTNRFTGHARRPYSVAEHSINVARFLPEPIKIYGLLHDAHEAYIGDISTPFKGALDWAPGFTEILARHTRRIDEAIYAALEIPPPAAAIEQAVKYADTTMGVKELRELFDHPPPDIERLPVPSWKLAQEAATPALWADVFRFKFERLRVDLRAASAPEGAA